MAGNFQAETIQSKAFWDCRGIVCIIPTLLQLPEVPHHLQTPALNTHSNSDHSHRDSMSFSFTHTFTLTHILEPCWHHRGRSHNCFCLEKRREKITDLLQNWPYSAVGEYQVIELVHAESTSLRKTISFSIHQFCSWSRTRVCSECRELLLPKDT